MKFSIITLGCKVNEYESQSIMAQLEMAGHQVDEGLVVADYYIVNTCAVTNIAERKSRQMIAKISKLNPNAKILICGCASQANLEQFRKYNQVEAIIGTHGKHNIVEQLEHIGLLDVPNDYCNTQYAKSTLTRQYIKVQDGCNNFCTYCIIPYTRGRSRSRYLQDILDEIKLSTALEIVITGIDVGDYRINGEKALITLLEEVNKLGKRFRISSIHCGVLTQDFLVRLSKCENFCPFFHISMQSASNATLKRMNRKYTIQQYIDVCNNVKAIFPTACISTDIIVGFKGETEEEFNETVQNLNKIPFSFMHIFPYSVRKGTVAEKLTGDVPSDVVKQRESDLKNLSDKFYNQFLAENIGKTHKVLVEEVKDGYSVGYTENYIYTYIDKQLPSGIYEVVAESVFKDGMKARLI
ncbi:MAG: tRNA (N(6)-L-threonylcarbamoyladenosine(37)-C(2))-methylthiotransferase MtaB [Clostridia bacterium]|nr:tRNA (N(6)-L-threonylcarbamoyladenosine(37)-C(2))-methylthiotransferase MtaB [Clostridia bacterium]